MLGDTSHQPHAHKKVREDCSGPRSLILKSGLTQQGLKCPTNPINDSKLGVLRIPLVDLRVFKRTEHLKPLHADTCTLMGVDKHLIKHTMST